MLLQLTTVKIRLVFYRPQALLITSNSVKEIKELVATFFYHNAHVCNIDLDCIPSSLSNMLKDFSVSSSDCDNRKSEAVGPAGLIGILGMPILELSTRLSLSAAALQYTVIQQCSWNGL